jgi:hypothetical protein
MPQAQSCNRASLIYGCWVLENQVLILLLRQSLRTCFVVLGSDGLQVIPRPARGLGGVLGKTTLHTYLRQKMVARERGRLWTPLLQYVHFWTLKHLLGVRVGDASSSCSHNSVG